MENEDSLSCQKKTQLDPIMNNAVLTTLSLSTGIYLKSILILSSNMRLGLARKEYEFNKL
jgi:hypothetical protein